MGWLEVEDICPSGRRVSVAAVWLPSFGAVHRGGQTSYDEREARIPTATSDWSRVRVPARPSFHNYMYCTLNVENPVKYI